MHTILNGILSYGLVNVPVGVCTAGVRAETRFKTLHGKCGQPIKAPKQCPTCQMDNLGADDLVKGYEFTKKNYVLVDEDMLGKIIPQRTGVIQLRKCVEWEDLDEMYVERHYYLDPPEFLPRPYQVLANALGAKEAVGIGQAALWGKQYPIAVWSRPNGVLVLSMLFEHADVRSDIEIVERFGPIPEDEQEMANMLVMAMLRPLNPQEDLVTEQRRLTDEYIASLVQGREFILPDQGVEREPTFDLREALSESIHLARVS